MRITVLGAGGWGTSLAILLHYNGHDVTLWEYVRHYAKVLNRSRENKIYLPGIKIPKEIDITHSLEDACTEKHMIVIAIPSQYIRSVISKVKKLDFDNTTFVSVSKGIEKDTMFTVSQILKDEIEDLSDSQIGVLSGPSHAEEVSKKIRIKR